MQVVATFYQFVALPDFADMRSPLLELCQSQGICGTILLAAEGINGTIAGDRASIDAVLAYLRRDLRLANLEHRESLAKTPPFERMKVRLKREIVTLGQPEADPNRQVGTYVTPEEWNQLLADPEVVVIDTRNHYEVAIGSFRGAQDPKTARSSDLLLAGDRLNWEDYGIVVREGNTELLESLNRGLLRLQEDDVFRQLDRRWFGQSDASRVVQSDRPG